jgi:uncharacterized membrane protein YdfJ with MMPL/SSD domain
VIADFPAIADGIPSGPPGLSYAKEAVEAMVAAVHAVVRGLLVPALVALFGRWNWWLPAPAARLLRISATPATAEQAAAPPVPAATPRPQQR